MKKRIAVNDIMSVKKTTNHLITSFEGITIFIKSTNCDRQMYFLHDTIWSKGTVDPVPIGVIAQQIRLLLAENYQEIVFYRSRCYGLCADLPGKPSFAQMIRRIFALIPNL